MLIRLSLARVRLPEPRARAPARSNCYRTSRRTPLPLPLSLFLRQRPHNGGKNHRSALLIDHVVVLGAAPIVEASRAAAALARAVADERERGSGNLRDPLKRFLRDAARTLVVEHEAAGEPPLTVRPDVLCPRIRTIACNEERKDARQRVLGGVHSGNELTIRRASTLCRTEGVT